MKVEVYDPDNNLISSFPGGKRKGINVVNWYMRLKPPKVAPSPTLAWGALFGPMAREGEYTVRVIKGKNEYVGSVALMPDPTSPHTAEDRAFQHEIVMKLYHMQSELAYVARAVADARDQANERAASLSQDKLSKDLTEFADQLDKLHGILVVAVRLKQGISGKEQLRERVVNLYQVISSYGGKPTQSQLNRLLILESEIEQASSDFETITSEKLTQLNDKLQEKGLSPITLLDREEFEKQSK